MTTNQKDEAKEPKLYRLIDANLNRLREGIRVVEDIQRYIFDNPTLTKKLKSIRHQVRSDTYKEELKYRDIIGDVSKKSLKSEKDRKDIKSIMIANIKRAQESSRVLEECFKIFDIKKAEEFKLIRYELYDIEKELFLNENI